MDKQIITAQREYFLTGETLPLAHRKAALQGLRRAILRREEEIAAALAADLGKSHFESYMCEIGLVLEEIRYMLRHLPALARKHRVKTPLAQFCAASYVQPTPRGNTLIMSPWNYPFLLSVGPLVDAIAAGNTVVLKPSAYSPATSKLLVQLMEDCFAPKEVAVITGGREENSWLLNQKFDFVFFTGSTNVGREVLRHTAEYLTPAVLELGGKSPCIVDETANIPLAARRIVFGKFLNAGQTCVAPDYILCHNSVRSQLIDCLRAEIDRQLGQNPLQNPDYCRIVNQKHYRRLMGLIDPAKVVVGGIGNQDSLKIAPTIMDGVTKSDRVMGEEIFGPILPIIPYTDFDSEVYAPLQTLPKSLALYIFTGNTARANRVVQGLRYGGGCVNDVLIHLATTQMGFGGVGESGMGAYHGRRGFEAFSHQKSIVDKKCFVDLPMRYQPYNSKLYQRLVRLFLR